MGMSPSHATSVPLVLDPSIGSITPKYHVIFVDFFNTVTATEGEVPDFSNDPWHKMFGDTLHQYHVDKSLEDEVKDPTDSPTHIPKP